jgi:RNA polymerase sigma factor (sigma-70 family)
VTTGQEQAAPDTAAVYQDLRPLLFSIAYRMLGSVTEAEDVVQEAFLRYHRVTGGQGQPGSPKAYLSTVVTRLCIDQLRSARARRESYVGEWRHSASPPPIRLSTPSRRTRCRWPSCCCWNG